MKQMHYMLFKKKKKKTNTKGEWSSVVTPVVSGVTILVLIIESYKFLKPNILGQYLEWLSVLFSLLKKKVLLIYYLTMNLGEWPFYHIPPSMSILTGKRHHIVLIFFYVNSVEYF